MTDMTETVETLHQLERQMSQLCASRDQLVDSAREAIKQANKAFDREAVPLARKIHKLREALAEAATPDKTVTRTVRSLETGHDPEWSQEDIDHFYELKRAASGR